MVDGKVVGSDSVGMAGWLDWTAAVHHRVVDLTPLMNVSTGSSTTLVLAAGCGAWCPSTAPTWEHSHRTINTPDGAQPVLRALVVVENESGTESFVSATSDRDGARGSDLLCGHRHGLGAR